ncbi:hypothetical protein F1735_22905 [Massilia sp. CCM 8694]|uniref:Secreted protein n=1 Tax=Massilia genomosp. 1 TaxID=2609280 RepID=A0ABX0N4R8_9BURK|nr:hypothetical protein [Massilia genomosp. 1]
MAGATGAGAAAGAAAGAGAGAAARAVALLARAASMLFLSHATRSWAISNVRPLKATTMAASGCSRHTTSAPRSATSKLPWPSLAASRTSAIMMARLPSPWMSRVRSVTPPAPPGWATGTKNVVLTNFFHAAFIDSPACAAPSTCSKVSNAIINNSQYKFACCKNRARHRAMY